MQEEKTYSQEEVYEMLEDLVEVMLEADKIGAHVFVLSRPYHVQVTLPSMQEFYSETPTEALAYILGYKSCMEYTSGKEKVEGSQDG